MRTRTKQITLAAALFMPVLWSVVATPPFVAQPAAQGSGGGGMFGPLAPANAGGVNFHPTLASGSTYVLNNPWDCNGSNDNNRWTFGGGPPFTSVTRNNRSQGQTVRIAGYTGGRPTSFSYEDSAGGVGTARLADTNSDGVYDTLIGDGTKNRSSGVQSATAVSFSLSLQYRDSNSDGQPDQLSLPWSEVNALGWLAGSDGCNDTEPQAWMPLADTNSDGKPDTIVFDLDGNGTADPTFYAGPPIVPTTVPSVNWSGLALLAVLLTSLAAWGLARRGGVQAV